MGLLALLLKAISLSFVVLVGSYIYSYLASPLRSIPGPFWASFSNFWRLINHYNGTQIAIQQKLHEELGPAVRIGPNFVSLSDPALIKTVYSTRGDYFKSDFYSVNDAVQNGQTIQNVFGTRSNAYHGKYMRPIQKLYTMTRILDLEDLVNKTVVSLCEQLDSRFIQGNNKGKICDIGEFIGFYAWDVIGEITFSQPMGFLQSGVDSKDFMQSAETMMHYFGIVGQMPILDKWLGKNSWCPIKFPTFGGVAGYCLQRVMERVSNPDIEKAPKRDFLNSFLEAKALHPDIVGDNEVVGYLLINVLAGADTTAIGIKAILYYVLQSPSVLAKLQAELDAANLPYPAPYEVAVKLPYLEAVIKESLRIHPIIGHILERIVPATGLALADGTILPPGTIVGMQPWVVTRAKEVYGDDVETFRPERWLKGEGESEEAAEVRVKRMRDVDFTFGGGNRVCIGRNLATVELYKVTATLFSRYSMELQQDWHLRYWWFVFADKIRVKITPRTSGGKVEKGT